MTATILTIVGGLISGGLLTGVLLHFRESPKAKADAAKTLADTAITIAENLEQRVGRLERREFVYINYAEQLRAHINAGNPPPPPPWPEELKER